MKNYTTQEIIEALRKATNKMSSFYNVELSNKLTTGNFQLLEQLSFEVCEEEITVLNEGEYYETFYTDEIASLLEENELLF